MLTFAADSGMELATPTGLAVLKTLAHEYGPVGDPIAGLELAISTCDV